MVVAQILAQKRLTERQQGLVDRLSEALPFDLKDVSLEQENPLFNYMPADEELVHVTGVSDASKLKRSLSAIESRWALPDTYLQGDFTELQSRVRRVVRQHRQRLLPDGGHREDRTFLLMGPMGTASRIIDPDAYKGLAVITEAYGFNETMKGMVASGDVVPEIGAYWTIRLQDQNVLMGKLPDAVKTVIEARYESVTGESAENVLPQGRFDLEALMKDPRMGESDIEFLDEVGGTINSLEAALETAAHHVAPVVSALPRGTDIVFQWGVKDWFNIRERLKYFVSTQEKIKAMEIQAEKIPEVEESIVRQRKIYAQHRLNYTVGNYVMGALQDDSRRVVRGEGDDAHEVLARDLTGQEFRNYIKQELLGEEAPGFSDVSSGWRDSYFTARAAQTRETQDLEDFGDALNTALLRYTRDQIRSLETVNDRLSVSKNQRNGARDKLEGFKTKLEALEDLAARIETEKRQNMAHVTGQYAIEASDAKAMNLIVKKRYGDAYQEQFVERLEDLVGHKLNAHVLKRVQAVIELGNGSLDSEDPVFTAASDHGSQGMELYLDKDFKGAKEALDRDAQELEQTEIRSSGGVKFSLTVAPNFSRSNEPVFGNLAHIQMMHDEAIARQFQMGRSPEEFTGVAAAEVFFTAYGADGWQHQPKMRVAETVVEGQYRETPEVVHYIKGVPMHDVNKLSRAKAHGNKIWDIKRYDKGGVTPGAAFLTLGADNSSHVRFFGTAGLAAVGKEVYDEYATLKEKLKKARGKSKATIRAKLETLYAKVRVDAKLALDHGDFHYGVSHTKGRSTQHETTLAGGVAFVDRMGIPDFAVHSEVIHGKMKIRAWGYDCTIENAMKASSLDTQKLLAPLYARLKDGDISAEQMLFLNHLFSQELASYQFIEPVRQLDMFRQGWAPVSAEMMTKGARVAYLSGNHWNTSCNSDEAHNIVQLFDPKWRDLGLLHYVEGGYGNSQTAAELYLPGTDEVAMVFHKMWHGKTEVDRLGTQAKKTRSAARYFLTDDRHQPGASITAGKFALLSPGNQPWNPYVPQIGKTGSLRGSSYFLYDDEPEKDMFGYGFFLDDSIEPIIGWEVQRQNLEYIQGVRDAHNFEFGVATQRRQVERESSFLERVTNGEYSLGSGTCTVPPGRQISAPTENPAPKIYAGEV